MSIEFAGNLRSVDGDWWRPELDAITSEDVQRFKASRSHLSTKTINNILATLSTILKCAVEWKVIEQLPAQVKRMRVSNPSMDFYDFEEYEQLIAAARKRSSDHLAFVLLGGDAGLRAGEIRGLHWTSVDLRRRLITVECSEYKGEFTTPKHDKIRTVPMTMRLAAALAARRGLGGALVFSKGDDLPITTSTGVSWLKAALKAAKLRVHGPHTRWRRPPITRQAWLENQRLSLGTPTGNQPIRVSASELGVREADVHGSVRSRLRGY